MAADNETEAREDMPMRVLIPGLVGIFLWGVFTDMLVTKANELTCAPVQAPGANFDCMASLPFWRNPNFIALVEVVGLGFLYYFGIRLMRSGNSRNLKSRVFFVSCMVAATAFTVVNTIARHVATSSILPDLLYRHVVLLTLAVPLASLAYAFAVTTVIMVMVWCGYDLVSWRRRRRIPPQTRPQRLSSS